MRPGISTAPTWTPRPGSVVAVGLGSLAALLGLVVAVDVLGLPPADALADRGSRPVWYHLFQGDSAAEWLQAVGLVGFVILAGVHGGWLRRAPEGADADVARPLLLLAVGAGLLLLEDTGDIGQRVGDWTGYAVGDRHVLTRVVRLPFFVAGAGVLTWGLWSGRGAVRRHRLAGALLVGGWATYGVMAVIGEVLHLRYGVYRPLGALVAEDVFGGALAPAAGMVDPLWGPYEVVLMDTMWEESLELVAIVLLLAGVARLARTAAHPDDS